MEQKASLLANNTLLFVLTSSQIFLDFFMFGNMKHQRSRKKEKRLNKNSVSFHPSSVAGRQKKIIRRSSLAENGLEILGSN